MFGILSTVPRRPITGRRPAAGSASEKDAGEYGSSLDPSAPAATKPENELGCTIQPSADTRHPEWLSVGSSSVVPGGSTISGAKSLVSITRKRAVARE
jgi:hypothetical protein